MLGRCGVAVVVGGVLAGIGGARAEAPVGASSPAILSPADGATVTSPVTVRIGGGAALMHSAGGAMRGHAHLHLVIDDAPPRPGAAIPMDLRHRHLMGGETRITVPLAPGRHTLQLVLAGGDHVVGNPPVMSQPVTISVK